MLEIGIGPELKGHVIMERNSPSNFFSTKQHSEMRRSRNLDMRYLLDPHCRLYINGR